MIDFKYFYLLITILVAFQFETNMALAFGHRDSYLGSYSFQELANRSFLKVGKGFYISSRDLRSAISPYILKGNSLSGPFEAVIRKEFHGYQMHYRSSSSSKYSFRPYSRVLNIRVRVNPRRQNNPSQSQISSHSSIPINSRASSSPQKNMSVGKNPNINDTNKSCSNVYNVLDKLNETEAPTLADDIMRDKCLKNRNDRSFDCIHWITHQAVRAMNTTSDCAGRVTVDKLMCIYMREQSSFDQYACNKSGSACGLSQITNAGVDVVKRGFNQFGLAPQWDLFWQMINRPEGRYNKCYISKKTALDRDYSIIMAATHYCAQFKHDSKKSDLFSYCEYNQGQQYCKNNKGINHYARLVDNCDKGKVWRRERKKTEVVFDSNCRKYKNCDLDGVYRFAGNKAYNPSGFSVK